MKECGMHRLVADVALFADGKVLMVKYKDTGKYDGQRGWFLLDEYLNHLEHPGDAAKRILREQAGIDILDMRLAFIESFGNGWWHLVFHFQKQLDRDLLLKPGENIAAMEWFSLDRLPPASEIAHHGWALDVLEAMGIKPA